MAKDSYWFRHDSTAGRGTRMRKIAFIYSHWGKGVYWDVIELLRDQEDYKFSSDEFDLKMLADLIGCKDENKFLDWFNDCVKFGLLTIEDNYFFSEVLCDNMKRWESSKSNGSKGGRPPKEKPKKNLDANPTNNLDETIIEEDSIEDKKTEDKKDNNASIISQVKPSHLPSFLNWLEYRKETKKEIKVKKTLESLVITFNKHSVECCEWVTNNSIENGYQGLFWDNYTEKKKKPFDDGRYKTTLYDVI